MLKKRSRIESFSSRPSGEKTRTGTNFKPTGSGLLPEKDKDKDMSEQKIYYTGRDEGGFEDGRSVYWVSLCDTKDIIEEEGADVHTDWTGDMSTYGYPHQDVLRRLRKE